MFGGFNDEFNSGSSLLNLGGDFVFLASEHYEYHLLPAAGAGHFLKSS